tara:strand:+ start:6291 stop:6554 length:264 start_codon:yes stop_codon:yes gene_type:complete
MSDITKWQNNTYVLLSDLHDDHEVALVENSLRDSEFDNVEYLNYNDGCESIGVYLSSVGTWTVLANINGDDSFITRNQALKLAGVEL